MPWTQWGLTTVILTFPLWHGPNCMLKEDSLCSHSQYWSALPPATSPSFQHPEIEFVLLATGAVSAFILCFTQLPAWESLRIFLQQQDRAAPGRTHPSVSHSSFFTNIPHWQEGAASLFSSGSLDYKWEWFNLYFRGREYLGFLDISSPPQEILRQEKESWNVDCTVMGSRHCWEAGMLLSWVGVLRVVWGLEKQPWCLWFLSKIILMPHCWLSGSCAGLQDGSFVISMIVNRSKVDFLKIHMVKEQALWRKFTNRGWQEEKGNVILVLSMSI